MLDKKSLSLLEVINKEITDNSYKVIDKEELFDKVKIGQNINLNELTNMMYELQKQEFIDIKYSDAQVFCLAVKPKGRYKKETVVQEVNHYKKFKKLLFLYVIMAGMSAFLGTAAAIYLFLRS